jgi:hypothetical protein
MPVKRLEAAIGVCQATSQSGKLYAIVRFSPHHWKVI